MNKYVIYLILGVIFLVLSAFFSASETAFDRLNKYRFEAKKQEGKKSAALVLWLYKRKDTNLIAILTGNTIVNNLLSIFSTSIFLHFITNIDDVIVSLISSIIVTLIVYLFGETMPKQIAAKIPNTLASIFAYPLVIIYFLFLPLSFIFRAFIICIEKLFPKKKGYNFSEDDFSDVLRKNEKGGLLEKNETEIIENSIDFSDTAVRDVLTKKDKMMCIDLKGLSSNKLIDILCSTSYSRIPVYYENKDKIIGILLVKQYLAAYLADPKINILSYVEKPYIVTPNIKIDDLADGFREHHTQIAIVMKKDEIIGMVTMEDVLEELVGPISESIALENKKQ